MSTTATRFKTRAQARAIEKEIVNTASRVVKLDKSISKLREQIETATQREDDPEVIAQMAQKLSRLLQAAEKVGLPARIQPGLEAVAHRPTGSAALGRARERDIRQQARRLHTRLCARLAQGRLG